MRWIRNTVLLLFGMVSVSSYAQNIELSTRPEQILTNRNIEVLIVKNMGTWRLGGIIAFMPSRLDSGRATPGGGGAAATYDDPLGHRAYTMLGIGALASRNIGTKLYVSSELLFRDYRFSNKYIFYDNDERPRSNVDALRSEEVQAFILKSYFTIEMYRNNWFFVNGMMGAGLRYRQVQYTTHSGKVGGNFVTDLTERFSEWVVTPQVGIRVGVCLGKQIQE